MKRVILLFTLKKYSKTLCIFKMKDYFSSLSIISLWNNIQNIFYHFVTSSRVYFFVFGITMAPLFIP